MKIEVRHGDNVKQFSVSTEEQGGCLLEFLLHHEIFINVDCGGNGRCGKCRVQFLTDAPEASAIEKQRLTDAELDHGWRLACVAKVFDGAIIYVPEVNEDEMDVQGDYAQKNSAEMAEEISSDTIRDFKSYGIAVDIGTTTIAISLVDLITKTVIDTYATVNHQRCWGGDVISRIKAATEGHQNKMQESICNDLRVGIEHLLEKWGITLSCLKKIVIAGNTTMGHLFCGFSCEGLGTAPYTPVDISTIRRSTKEMFGWQGSQAEVILLPGISTYVGADVIAGMYHTGMHKSKEICVLVDLGTNGEMAIGCKDGFLVTSTAAGPAFEGGNISCGAASVPGAICHVTIQGDEVHTETIQDKKPIAVCGTGVIETAYELMKNEIIDETGLLNEKYFKSGFSLETDANGHDITFLQKDIREIQLAKSAVRAGLECLLLRYGVTYEDVAHVYIAGGFGYQMDVKKAAGIGMFPPELLPKMKAVGNTSLGGAVAGLLEESALREMEQIVAKSEEMNLAMTKEFQDLYIEYMMF